MAPHATVFHATSHALPHRRRRRRRQLGPPSRVPCCGLLFPGSAHPCLESRRRPVAVRVAASPPPPSDMVGADERAALERCFRSAAASLCSLPTMKGQYGAFGAVTLEKSKLDLSQKTTRTSPETSLGGGGGDIGKRNSHGGGDGGDDGGDDDDYFGDFDDFDVGDEGGLFRRRLILQELFDRKFVDAVLQEWYKTMINLPSGLRQAYEMGLVSSAQMVRFLAINARPTITRFISRALPESLSREFIGRSSWTDGVTQRGSMDTLLRVMDMCTVDTADIASPAYTDLQSTLREWDAIVVHATEFREMSDIPFGHSYRRDIFLVADAGHPLLRPGYPHH